MVRSRTEIHIQVVQMIPYCEDCSKPDKNGWISSRMFYDGTKYQCMICGKEIK